MDTKPISTTSSVESTLISIISLGTRISQSIGYFTLSVTTNSYDGQKKITFSWLSFPIFCSVMLLSIQTYLVIHWSHFGDELVSMTGLTSPTEVLAFNLSGFLVGAQIFFKRLMYLFNSKGMMTFWSDFVSDLTQISCSDEKGSFLLSTEPWAKHRSMFIKVKTTLTCDIISSLILITVQTVQLLVTFYLSYVEDSNTNGPFVGLHDKIIGIGGLVLWNVLGSLNVFQSVWVTYPIQLFNAYLEIIQAELSECYRCNQEPLVADDLFTILKKSGEKGSQKMIKPYILDENKLHLCIQNYHRTVEMLRKYSSRSVQRISSEIGYNSLLILAYLFIGFTWAENGEIGAALTRVIPLILCIKIIFHLGTEAGQLELNQKAIFRVLCRMQHRAMSEETKSMVFTMIQELSGDRLRVEPGSFFTLNRRLLTSILSSVMTFLVVLVQFRDGERK
ncbi:putative gustatory receptor 23a, isoform B [Folsomia candida]|uniref:Putative gustatory receptor 23a, isoform B n=2 Tax=Folsomia candida TaxID=158441 RepID=A0A226CWS5_FOLCA|nr:putative gustatory receptor 23a, isoform B [Folsomia candida]